MPMGLVDDDIFESEISDKKPMPSAQIIQRPFHGRNPGDNNIPQVIREVIADDTSTSGEELSNKFDVSKSSVSAYRNGATSTSSYDAPSPKLQEIVDRKRERISRKSSKALMKVLDKMNDSSFDEKLDACKAVELSTIAANMSRVVEKVSTKNEAQNIQQNIVFYSPSPVKTDQFEIIDLGRKLIDSNHPS